MAEIRIIRSHRRRRTVSARLEKDTLVISIPAALSGEKLESVIKDIRAKIERKKLKEDLKKNEDLYLVAQRLNKKYFDNRLKINAIEYSTVQTMQFGSCNFRTGHIRISHRLRSMPEWVRDYVIVHEMAHLVKADHSKEFWKIVQRYELAERARGYLIAVGFQMDAGIEPAGESVA